MTRTSAPDNRQELPNAHYQTHPAQKACISFVATPIGNLSDLSSRAYQVLEAADEVWAEDTRHTQALLSALAITGKRIERVDQHSDVTSLKKHLARVQEKALHVALVSDAGTPGISDPGAKIVQLIVHFPNVQISPIPGPSALTALASVAGLDHSKFSFLGFFPRDHTDQQDLLKKLETCSTSRVFFFFESPNRIRATFEALLPWAVKLTVRFIVAKEISKIHETLWIGEGGKFLQDILHQSFDERGEWCFGIDLSNQSVKNENPEPDWGLTLECLLLAGVKVKEASQIVQGRFSVAKNLAYKTALEMQKKLK